MKTEIARMIGSEMTEASVIGMEWVLIVPLVENPSSDWNIQKKLLDTWGTKITNLILEGVGRR